MNLFEKIQAVSMEVMNIEKDMQVGTGNSAYKAVSDTAVISAVKRAEEKYKLISIPIKVERIDGDVILGTPDQYGKQSKTYVDNIKMTTEIIDLENPSDRISVESFGKGIDTGDKGFGKASTYARKYALLNAYKIFTGEDPDKDASPKENEVQAKADDKKTKVLAYLMQNTDYRENVLRHFCMPSIDDLTDSQLAQVFTSLTKKGLL
jgi:hypothetical protein